MDPTAVMLSILFGSIGLGLFVYGKKQGKLVHLIAGLLLMVVPYVVPGAVMMTVVCGVLVALPFLL